MGNSASVIERAMARPAIRCRVAGMLAVVAFLIAAWFESRFSTRSLVDWVAFSIVCAGFLGVAAMSCRPRVTCRPLKSAWLCVLVLSRATPRTD